MAMDGKLVAVIATGDNGLLSGSHDGARVISNCPFSESQDDTISQTRMSESEFSFSSTLLAFLFPVATGADLLLLPGTVDFETCSTSS